MQPSITPRPSARAACAMRTASRMPPDLASLMLIPCARSAHARDVRERVAVLVDVDRHRRRALQLRPVRDRRPAAAARSTRRRARQLRQRSSASSSDQYSLTSTWSGSSVTRAHGAHALDVEAVAAAELELQPAEAPRRAALGAPRHVVRVAEPDRPRRRRALARQPEQPPDRAGRRACPADRAAQRRSRRAPRTLAGGSRSSDRSSANGSSPSTSACSSTIRERGRGGLVVTLDRRRLAEPGDVRRARPRPRRPRPRPRPARDRERLGELERDDPGGQLHRGLH